MSVAAKSLVVEKLVVGYGGIPVLRDVSFQAQPGEILTVVGPNGSGKSTLMKSVLGLLSAESGHIFLDGKDITAFSTPARVNAGLGYVPQEANVFPNLSVVDNLRLGHEFIRNDAGKSFSARLDEVLPLFPEIAPKLKTRAGVLSGGQRQMVAMAAALMPEPSILALDEPSAGLSPRNAALLFDIIRRIASSGVTLFLIEQNTKLGLEASDKGLVLVGGQVHRTGSAQEILADQEIRDLYLGGA